jgi:NTE family protein
MRHLPHRSCHAFTSGTFDQDASEHVALILQGGGALGAYQVGAIKSVFQHGYQPDVVAGISIGAVNAAIVAGNKPEDRLAKLVGFWEYICRKNPALPFTPPQIDAYAQFHHWIGVWQAVWLGQPNFFKPRMVNPAFMPAGSAAAVSYCDQSAMRDTLLKFVDFDYINSKAVRLFIGAVKVSSGEMVYFDNAVDTFTPEHIMASGALPPGFEGVRINGELYWDGGCASNSPIDPVLDAFPNGNMRIFMPTLFNPQGPDPKTMGEVEVRAKQIQYAMRSRRHIENVLANHKLRRLLALAVEKAAANGADVEELLAAAQTESRNSQLHIVHVMYKWPGFETQWADTDFSPVSIERRIRSGFEDMEEGIELAGLQCCNQNPCRG